MAKVIWRGEDHLHATPDEPDRAGPSFTIWNKVKFPKGVPVEVTNEKALSIARENPFFDVIEDGEDLVGDAAKAAGSVVEGAADVAADVAGKAARAVRKATS